MKRTLRDFLIAHIFIALVMFFYYNEFSLHSYINTSFIVGGLVFLVGLISFVFSTGFFDVFTVSMRKALTSKHRMDDVMSMRKPSEIFSSNVSPLLACGGLVLTVMGIALVTYYL